MLWQCVDGHDPWCITTVGGSNYKPHSSASWYFPQALELNTQAKYLLMDDRCESPVRPCGSGYLKESTPTILLSIYWSRDTLQPSCSFCLLVEINQCIVFAQRAVSIADERAGTVGFRCIADAAAADGDGPRTEVPATM